MTDSTYRFAAYVPDPRGGDNNFTYDDLVTVRGSPSNQNVLDVILKGFTDHIFSQTKVRVKQQKIVIQLFALASSDAQHAGE